MGGIAIKYTILKSCQDAHAVLTIKSNLSNFLQIVNL